MEIELSESILAILTFTFSGNNSSFSIKGPNLSIPYNFISSTKKIT